MVPYTFFTELSKWLKFSLLLGFWVRKHLVFWHFLRVFWATLSSCSAVFIYVGTFLDIPSLFMTLMSEVYYLKWTTPKDDLAFNSLVSSKTMSIITRQPSRELFIIFFVFDLNHGSMIFSSNFIVTCITHR